MKYTLTNRLFLIVMMLATSICVGYATSKNFWWAMATYLFLTSIMGILEFGRIKDINE